MRYRLFVYGTLKSGFSNHIFLKGAKFLGRAQTKKRYPMIVANRPYPYLIDKEGEGERVYGELYEVDLPTLKRIDRLEEYPLYYKRKEIEVECEGRGQKALCYFLNRPVPYRKFKFLKEF